ncbi:hypothetical protein PVAP13_7KG201710 [Panicum virgatum]|uniref:Uncharacterized protein n=1 Tax=Panicum virgatum TaxID=38727 RepID=A0A8T0QFG1_PANVG|nr:hypothetical protein PVAP13_7KG201710 [Panicum virgatum]
MQKNVRRSQDASILWCSTLIKICLNIADLSPTRNVIETVLHVINEK